MKTIIVIMFLAVTGVAYGQKTPNGMMKSKEIACKLTTTELQKRKATVLAELMALTIERKEIKEGYAFKFEGSDQNLDKLVEFVKTERACCDFFTFNLIIEEGIAWLKITGPEGSKEFMKDEMGL